MISSEIHYINSFKRIKYFIFISIFTMCFSANESFSYTLESGIEAYHEKDHVSALSILEPFAKEGNVEAQYLLGNMYSAKEMRRGIPMDLRKAFAWWRRAAELGHPEAQFKTGYYLMSGQGVVARDRFEAVKWYRRSAEQGHQYAQQELGMAYQYGKGVPRDYVLAYMWLNISSASNWKWVRNAIYFRDDLAEKMTAEQIAKAQEMARDWLSRN